MAQGLRLKPSPAAAKEAAASRPTRVVLLQTQAEAAGAQEISRLLARGLNERGHDVHQVFLFRRTSAFDGDPNAVVCADTRPSTPAALVRMLVALRRELRRLRPDVVVSFQHFGNLIGGPVARLAGVPTVVANHNGLMEILSPAVVRMDRLLGTLGIYSRIVVNSAETEAEYGDHPTRYRERLIRIDHGFAEKTSRLDRAAARASFGLPTIGMLLGSVARLHPGKRLELAIRLLPGHPGWRLALAGQGEARSDLERLATELGCRDRVHFLGELSPDRVGDLLAALDVFVFPTASETFGLAAVEAAQAGVPVVATALPVLHDVLSHRGQPAALFVDPTDAAAFGSAVRRCQEEPELSRALAGRGSRLRERFPLAAMVDAYDAVIRDEAGRKAG